MQTKEIYNRSFTTEILTKYIPKILILFDQIVMILTDYFECCCI